MAYKQNVNLIIFFELTMIFSTKHPLFANKVKPDCFSLSFYMAQ